MAARLEAMGMNVLAVDIDKEGFKAGVPFIQMDLNMPDFAAELGEGCFDLVTAVEVIEHLENPIGFLRNVRRLLKPEGVAVLTTPNVDNVLTRVKFLLLGILRKMDDKNLRDLPHNLAHISLIFIGLFIRRYLPRAGLQLVGRGCYPPDGYLSTRPIFARPLGLLARWLPGEANWGDSHIFVLKRGTA